MVYWELKATHYYLDILTLTLTKNRIYFKAFFTRNNELIYVS